MCHSWQSAAQFFFFLPSQTLHGTLPGMACEQIKCVSFMAECCPIFLFPSFPNSSWHSAMNGMHNLNACCSWQSAAQFFSFLPSKTLHGTLPGMACEQIKCVSFMAECCPFFLFPSFPNSSWQSAMNGMHNLNACCSWQSAAQFFFFLPSKTLHGTLPGMACEQIKCVSFMAECCPFFLFPSFPNSSWHSAMNGMHNLNACCSWQSAAQFFFFLPSQTLHGTLP